jgi:hypothetical protein
MNPTTPLPITNVITTIHIVGPEGNRKKVFIQKKLSQFPCFNVISYFTQLTSTLKKEVSTKPPLLVFETRVPAPSFKEISSLSA